MDLQGSQTMKNLMATFAGESQARNRYTYFASVAKKEGYMQICDIFLETADQEREHAKRMFKFMDGGTSEVADWARYPFGIIGTTDQNLTSAAAGEHEEYTILYPNAAKIAREEGFEPIAKMYEAICVAEQQHEKRYLDLLRNIQEDKVFKREGKVVWRCRNCGYLHIGTEAPEICPACIHPQAYFELLGENY